MANVESSNTFYVDATTPTLAIKNLKLHAVIYTPSNTSNQLILQDVTTGNTKLSIKAGTSNVTEIYTFHRPMVFPNGINPSTVTNCVATLIVERT